MLNVFLFIASPLHSSFLLCVLLLANQELSFYFLGVFSFRKMAVKVWKKPILLMEPERLVLILNHLCMIIVIMIDFTKVICMVKV